MPKVVLELDEELTNYINLCLALTRAVVGGDVHPMTAAQVARGAQLLAQRIGQVKLNAFQRGFQESALAAFPELGKDMLKMKIMPDNAMGISLGGVVIQISAEDLLKAECAHCSCPDPVCCWCGGLRALP